MMEKPKNLSNKDIVVELMRIAASLIVVATHVKPDCVFGSTVSKSCVMIACLAGDGVAIFWLILGFFCFRPIDYGSRLKHLLKRILIPLTVYSAIMFYLYDWLVAGLSFSDSIQHSGGEYGALLFDGLFKWQNAVPHQGHLWFLYVYSLVVLLMPAISGMRNICINQDARGKNDVICMAVAAILLILNDITGNELLEITHHSFRGAVGAVLFVLAGDVLYRNRARFEGKIIYAVGGIVGFAVTNSIRFAIQYSLFKADPSNREPIQWYTSFAFFAVICLSLFFFGISDVLRKNSWCSSMILHLSKLSFLIYLIHYPVRDYFRNRGLQAKLIDLFGCYGVGPFIYQILYMSFIFLISASLSEILLLVICKAGGNRKRFSLE